MYFTQREITNSPSSQKQFHSLMHNKMPLSCITKPLCFPPCILLYLCLGLSAINSEIVVYFLDPYNILLLSMDLLSYGGVLSFNRYLQVTQCAYSMTHISGLH